MPNHTILDKIENGGANALGRLNAAETNELLRLLNLMPLPVVGLTMAQLQAADEVYDAGRLIIESNTLTMKLADGRRSYNQLPPLGTGRASQATTTILATYKDPTLWTPVVADHPTEGNVATVATAEGAWMQVGNLVHLSCKITGINKTPLTAGNPLYIRGLPARIRSGALNCFTSSVRSEFVTFSGALTPFADDQDPHVLFYQNVSAGASALLNCSALAAAAASSLRFSMSFITE